MKSKLILLLTLMTVAILPAATLSGLIKDIKTKKPLEFANVAVYEQETKTIKTGTMSGVDGSFRIFNIPAGKYYLVISYMGYEKKQFDNVSINGKKLDVGNILLTPTAIKMDNVTVVADKPAITYKIDKQVIDARQFPMAKGGSAVNILEYIPSVTVDIDGKVSLQGNSDISVMIDGRPSILNPQDALKTTPADIIENIEIMTNPSAKYEAEGGAGIINIITKKNRIKGLSGLTSLNASTKGLMASALLNYRNKKISAYASLDYRIGGSGNESFQDRYLYSPDTTRNYKFEGIRDNSWNNGGIKGGLDWYISKNDIFGFSANYRFGTWRNNYIKDYSVSYTDPSMETVFHTQDYINYENSNSDEMPFSIAADYTHTFPEKKEKDINDSNDPDSLSSSDGSKSKSSSKHKLKFAVSYSDKKSDRESFTYFINANTDTTEGHWTTKINPSRNIRGKIDYKLPLNNTSYFETGVTANFNWKSDGNNVYLYNILTDDFDLQNQFCHLTTYKQNSLSAFALYAVELGQLGIQPGLRAEYTYRKINSNALDSLRVIDSLHIFPSFHLSYRFPSNVQIMGSYSRRISRPPGWKLEPFYTWRDAYNIRIGNPALKPQIIDSYSCNIQKNFGRNSLSLNAFYTTIKDKIETIQTPYHEGEDIILSTYENVGKNQSAGLFVSSNLTLFSWWRINVSASLYYYQVESRLYGEDISKESINYSAAFHSTFVLPTKTRIQMFAAYMPKATTVQGSVSGMLITDLGINQDFFKRKLSASLKIRNLFGSNFTQRETYTPTSYTYFEYYRDAPTISLNLSLKINNYKRQRSINSGESDGFDSVDNSEY